MSAVRASLVAAFAFASSIACNGTGTGGTPAPTLDAALDATPAVDAGEDASIGSSGGLPTGVVDRAGRAGINLILGYGDDLDQDLYNKEPTYQDWSAVTRYDATFDRNLARADAIDGVNDWTPDGGVNPLRDPLKLDVLLVDTSIACTSANGFCEGGYLEIENELWLGGAAHKTCGGRTLPDDALDKTLSLLAAKKLTGVTDGVDAPTKPATRTFPYLATPN